MVTIRQFRDEDAPTLWALNNLPNIGATADPTIPLPLAPISQPPASFPDLADIRSRFQDAGGDFLVAERNDHLVAMGGIRPNSHGQAEVLRIRVHPATRRQGIGRALMTALEARAHQLGLPETHLDTATNQPEAIAFYRSLGYQEVGREQHPSWSWTLTYFVEILQPGI